jgi:fructose-1,6-bisphosphatase/inositol monophosphatase family enzyme
MLIVREAGGIFSDFSGGMKDLTGDETVATNKLIYPETIEIINKFMKNGAG